MPFGLVGGRCTGGVMGQVAHWGYRQGDGGAAPGPPASAARAVPAVILDGLALWGAGYAALAVLTRSLLLAMGYRPGVVPLMLAAGGQCLLAAVLAFRTRRAAAGLGLLVVVLGLASLRPQVRVWLADGLDLVREGLDALAQWASGTPPVVAPDLAWAAAILAPFLVAVAVLGFCARRRDPFWPLAAGAVIPILEWFSFFDRGLDYLAAYLVLSAAWLAAWRVTGIRAPAAGLSEGVTRARTTVWVAVLVLIALVPARGLSPYPVISPGRVSDWFVETIPGLSRLRGGGVQRAGFNPDARRLGGPVVPGRSVAMQVRINSAEVRPPAALGPRVPERLYLRGTVQDRYTGHGWEKSELPRFSFLFPAGGTPWLAGLGEDRSTYFLDVELQVRHRDLPYAYLFAPWIPVEVKYEGTVLTTVDREITVARRPREYAVRARVPLHTAAELRALTAVEAERWAPYLQLPPSLPPRVAEEARRVAAGASGPYEQACRLEEYLRQAYSYDPGVRLPRRDADFVADFLFDLKRGYCVHHSTAMAVMLRTLGVPARWVQGFVVDLRTGAWMDVPQASAHAWVEAFIPGAGWVTFDPTPRYPVPQREYAPAPEGGGAGAPAPGRPGGRPLPHPGRLEAEQGLEGGTGEAAPGHPRREPGFPRTSLAAVTLVLAVAIPGGRALCRVVRLRGASRRGAGESVPAFVLRQYGLAEHLLGLVGLHRAPWMTPREFLREFGARAMEGTPSTGEQVVAALAGLTARAEEAAFSPRGAAALSAGAAGTIFDEREAAREAGLVAEWVRRRMGRWRWLKWLALGPPLSRELGRYPSLHSAARPSSAA